jgi:hypothetical protein
MGAAMLGALLVAPACQNHQCEWGDILFYTEDPTRLDSPRKGELTSPDTWESTPGDADWIDFGPRRQWHFLIDPWLAEGRPIVEMHAFVSQSQHPNCSGPGCSGDRNFAEGTGNIAEFSNANPFGNVTLTNDTCAQYYVRVTLRAGPPTDASTGN